MEKFSFNLGRLEILGIRLGKIEKNKIFRFNWFNRKIMFVVVVVLYLIGDKILCYLILVIKIIFMVIRLN